MKSLKQDAEYIVDSFVDFKGDEHKIIGCVLNVKPYSNIGERFSVGWRSDGCIWIDDPDFRNIQEIISVGIMICHPCDEFDLEKGKNMAYEKALHNPKCPKVYVSFKGGKSLAKAFLKQEISFVKDNPGKIIKGYSQMKAGFEKKQNLIEKINNLSDKEKQAIALASEVDIAKCNELASRAKAMNIKLNGEN